MKCELKNVKINQQLSEETTCFSATLYVDGKKTAVVTNRGHGGCNDYLPSNQELFRSFTAYAKSLPPVKCSDGMLLDMDTDLFVGELLEKWELNKLCKNRTLFLLKGDDVNNGYRILKSPFNAKAKAFLVGKYGAQLGEIVNEQNL